MTADTAPRITVTADGRAVGYRRFGEGPPVVLLHASPRSAAALLPLGLRLADRFTVFALDTPGFGWSEPLRTLRPDAHDYGHALVAVFDALGLRQAPVYGSHTGAAIAVAAALDHPDRVTALALDGYAIFTATEVSEYLATYLAPIEPAWDGAYLAWLWGRVKDQFSFFPWYLRGDVARIARPLPPLAFMQGVVVDFLASGSNYRPGYASAFRFPGLDALRRLTVPTAAMARSDDLLFRDLDKLTALPACVSVRPLPADDAAWASAMADALSVTATGHAPPDRPHDRAGNTEVHRVPGGTIGSIRSGGTGRPIVLLPPIPGSARGEADLARAIATERPVIAVDLPGFGASALPGGLDAAGIAASVFAMLQQRGFALFDVAATGEAGLIGAALARLGDGRLALLDPVPDDARDTIMAQMPDVAPRNDGTHLLAAWHLLRDRCLWRPSCETTPAHAVPFGTDPDPARLHAVLADWLRGGVAGQSTLAASLATPLAPALAAFGDRAGMVLLPAHPWSSRLAGSMAVQAAEAGLDRHERAAAVLRLLAV